jgi:predicted GNAT family N-acyltransferase
MVTILPNPVTRPEIFTKVIDYSLGKTLIHAVRTEVFVYEQNIPLELEVDHLDRVSQHVLATYEGCPVGTGRLTPQGRIGRVAVSRPLRRQGVGQQIMEKLLALAQEENHQEVMLAAQLQATEFYKKLGFEREGDNFLEVGIWHINMRKRLSSW